MVLLCIMLYYIVLYCSILYYIVLYHVILHHNMSTYILYFSTLYHIGSYHIVLLYVMPYYILLLSYYIPLDRITSYKKTQKIMHYRIRPQDIICCPVMLCYATFYFIIIWYCIQRHYVLKMPIQKHFATRPSISKNNALSQARLLRKSGTLSGNWVLAFWI